MILEAKELTIGYGQTAVQSGLRCSLADGEMVCLLGPNGSGKSTLIRTLVGMQPALGGTLTLNGTVISELDSRSRAKQIALVLTSRSEVAHSTVREIIALGRTPYLAWNGGLSAEDTKAVDKAIGLVGIEHLADKKATQLSDGERQRVMIARAIAQDTPMLLLDEPTSFLDLPTRIDIMRLLAKLARETRKAILVSTHELDLAMHTANTIWLMQKGRGMSMATPKEVIASGMLNTAFASEHFNFSTHNGDIQLHYNFK